MVEGKSSTGTGNWLEIDGFVGTDMMRGRSSTGMMG
jgi:hypothetical protein